MPTYALLHQFKRDINIYINNTNIFFSDFIFNVHRLIDLLNFLKHQKLMKYKLLFLFSDFLFSARNAISIMRF